MSIEITLPDELIDQVVQRVLDVLAQQGPSIQPDPWMTVADAAAYLACRKQRIYNLVSQGRLRHMKDGSRTLFRRQWLDELAES